MLKLGKKIEDTTTSVEIFNFNLQRMVWSKLDKPVDFTIVKEPFASGWFRKAYKATSQIKGFDKQTWVVKKYLPETLNVIEQMNETVEGHSKKVVQMHLLAKNFSDQLAKEVKEVKCEEEFGPTLHYQDIYLGKLNQEFVTIEKYIPGSFIKYMNNTEQLCVDGGNEYAQKAECLSHFSFIKSQGKLMVMDIQGCGEKLYDPEIASSDLIQEGEVLFCAGNLSRKAIDNFIIMHTCNKYCKMLKLGELKLRDEEQDLWNIVTPIWSTFVYIFIFTVTVTVYMYVYI